MQASLARFFDNDLTDMAKLRWRTSIRQWGAGGDLPRPNGTGALWQKQERDDAEADAKDASESRTLTWFHILEVYVKRAMAETDDDRLQRALVQVAEEALSWALAIDQNEDEDDSGASQ